jgi:protein tyrosine phosphatase (PTP) superfamily phosphohydrolase (DUF442 family)
MSPRAVHACLLAVLAVAGCHTCQRTGFTTNRPCDCGDAYRQPIQLNPAPQSPARLLPRQPPIARLDVPERATYREPQDRIVDPLSPRVGGERLPDPEGPSGDFPPAEPDVKLLPPRAASPYRRDVAKAIPDNGDEVPKADIPNPLPKGDKAQPKESDVESLLRIRTAIPEVSAGLKPFDLADFKWLRKKGYRALLHLRDPDKDDVVAPRFCEKQGMVYRDFPVSPKTLTAKLYDDFAQIVTDTNNYPLYVYDKDGTVAGGLWYLYFRLEKNEDDKKARDRARRLGLDFESDLKEHRDMVLAVEKVLSERKP